MSLSPELIPDHIKQFRAELNDLCHRCSMTEIVALVLYGDNYTFILQGSHTGYSNESFNSIEFAIRAIMEDIQAKINNKPEDHG